MTLAGIGGLGPWELIIVLAIVLVVFGAGKLPNVGGSIGQAIRNFKKGMKGEDAEGTPGKPAEKLPEKPDEKKP
jgi:sec-independent protein translocase protein TatA